MRVEPFKCEVNRVSYHQLENANQLSDKRYYCKLDIETWENSCGEIIDKDANVYLANVKVLEKKQGKTKRKKYVTLTIYLTKEQFENKVIEQGDVLKINRAKIATDDSNITVYDHEKFKNYPKHFITKNDKGYSEIKLKVTLCRFSVEVDGWEMVVKGQEANYFKISGTDSHKGSKSKFFVENISSLLQDNEYNFYLEDKELIELQDIDNEIVDLKFYSFNQLKKKGTAELKILFDKETNLYYANISNINRY